MPKTIEIVTLVYRSIAYVDFAVAQLRRFSRVDDPKHSADYSVSFRLIANDATEPVLRRLSQIAATDSAFRCSTFSNSNPSEYYINRVYRAWNYAMRSSNADILCFSGGSDMAYSDGWLDALLRHHDGVNIPCSRLVEPGRDRSGNYGVDHPVFREGRHVVYGHFGDHPNRFRQDEWLAFANGLREEGKGRVEPSGFYACWLINRERFIESGGLPEGNVHQNGIGPGEGHGGLVASGDAWFFHEVLYRKFGMIHCTVFDSVVAHLKEGELIETERDV